MKFLLTVLIAGAGSYLFYRLHVPAGAMIGAILFCATFNIFTGWGEFPVAVKAVVQAIAGGFIGQRISKKDILELKSILGAGILMFLFMVAYTLVTGGIMSRFTQLDLATALASTMPAGLSDTALISADLGLILLRVP